MSYAIKTEELSKRFGRVQALNGLNLKDPFVDQLGDDLVGRIWIDLQFLAKDTHGREGIPRTHLTRHNGFFRSVDDLVAEGSSGAKRYLKWDHLS